MLGFWVFMVVMKVMCERERERERERGRKEERNKYILLCTYIILICYIRKNAEMLGAL